ncbi:hypothetical protein GPJ56_010749 [Histomonas meleagridis]|uniref:uncharacterized protein n=1 Tax=Histomonas meleagridis TaxID=135588 RepID=UPI00355A6140|nr:hypothetical protein GPJ56_010749 [Histomonas meleagridis]KAH0801084.1 hypothetical protein GO595_006119 [Histomonas meleagridis]
MLFLLLGIAQARFDQLTVGSPDQCYEISILPDRFKDIYDEFCKDIPVELEEFCSNYKVLKNSYSKVHFSCTAPGLEYKVGTFIDTDICYIHMFSQVSELNFTGIAETPRIYVALDQTGSGRIPIQVKPQDISDLIPSIIFQNDVFINGTLIADDITFLGRRYGTVEADHIYSVNQDDLNGSISSKNTYLYDMVSPLPNGECHLILRENNITVPTSRWRPMVFNADVQFQFSPYITEDKVIEIELYENVTQPTDLTILLDQPTIAYYTMLFREYFYTNLPWYLLEDAHKARVKFNFTGDWASTSGFELRLKYPPHIEEKIDFSSIPSNIQVVRESNDDTYFEEISIGGLSTGVIVAIVVVVVVVVAVVVFLIIFCLCCKKGGKSSS